MTETETVVGTDKDSPGQPFLEGVLCYVVRRKYKGEGDYKILLHEALPTPDGFGYGSGRLWVLADQVEITRGPVTGEGEDKECHGCGHDHAPAPV